MKLTHNSLNADTIFIVRVLIVLIAIISFGSCSKNTDKKSASTSKSTTESQIQPDKSTPDTTIHADSTKKSETGIPSKLSEIDYNINEIPNNILKTVEGKVVASARFIDSKGMNIILISETEQISGDDGSANKSLFGYHFISAKESFLLWKVNDFIRQCEVDVTLEYLENSLAITDLDDNGTGESTFLYKLSCKGDVSPDDMKLIMHEGEKKYAIRGTMDLDVTGYGFEKGNMKVDESFNSAPTVFKDYAVQRWNKFKLERIGN
ncbi:MAG: hypothetical protein WBC65_05010 [Ignavibacteria bacterium]|jgi:hypothetical protein